MKHFGDITKIDGHKVPVVDIITGGSPCQDLSIGKANREGLAGERSGLFHEMIRVVKEMREYDRKFNGRTDEFIRPRYLVVENVQGLLNANGGEDFRTVLEEICRIADSNTSIPRLPNGENWSNSGAIVGDNGNGTWSVSWRLHNSELWGVPQRRRRLAIIGSFGNQSAPKILFEQKGLQRNVGEGEKIRQTAPEDIGIRSVLESGTRFIAYRKTSHPQKSKQGQGWQETDVADTLNCFDFGETRTPTIIFEKHGQDTRFKELGDVSSSCTAHWGTGGNNTPLVLDSVAGLLRRLTPLEAERLQGFPDNWTNIGDWVDSTGKKRKTVDSQRFRALGNSLALPFWDWLADRMIQQLKADGVEHPTMASLFDGIGGFPLVHQRHGCEPVWASEIEEFPIAVTKKHFPEKEEQKGGLNET